MKNSLANIQSRRVEILEYLSTHSQASVSVLSEFLGVSKTTIRRDLDTLFEENIITRYHGGATIAPPVNMDDSMFSIPYLLDEKSDMDPLTKSMIVHYQQTISIKNEKSLRQIARQAAAFIQDNDIVFINSSRTASLVIDYITSQNVTVVTNNLLSISHLCNSNISLILTGGQIRKNSLSITGGITRDELSKVVANKCILGVKGISAHYGVTSPDLEESYINQKMLEQTNGEVFVVTDGCKVGRKDNFYICPAHRISCLITNASAPENELKALHELGVQSYIATNDSWKNEMEFHSAFA